jgi:streptogramin lyase
VQSDPSFLTVGTGAASGIWVVNDLGNTVVRIDPDTGKTRTWSVDQPWAVAATASDVWVTSQQNDSVKRIDASTGSTKQTLTLADNGIPNGPTDIVVAADGVWVASNLEHLVCRIDPATNQVVQRLPIHGIAGGMALDRDRNVWLAVHAQ